MLLITHILLTIYTQHGIEKEYYDWLSICFGNQFHNPDGIEVKTLKHVAKTNPTRLKRQFAVTWWSSDLRIQHHGSTEYIISKKHISEFKWIDSHTLEATCASSLANVSMADHVCYQVSLNCYGLAACTCPFSSNGNGACKHLWALQYLLPTLSPTVAFYFPLTEKAALEIHAVFFPP